MKYGIVWNTMSNKIQCGVARRVKTEEMFVLFLFRFWFGILWHWKSWNSSFIYIYKYMVYFFYLSTVVGGVRQCKYTVFTMPGSSRMEMCWRQKWAKNRSHTQMYEATPQPISVYIRFVVGCRQCVSHRFLCICDDDVTIFITAPHVCMANMSRYNL